MTNIDQTLNMLKSKTKSLKASKFTTYNDLEDMFFKMVLTYP